MEMDATLAQNPLLGNPSESSDRFDADVQLTEEETREILEKARRDKARKLYVEAQKRQYADKLRQQSEPMAVTAEQLYVWVIEQATATVPGFVFDEHNTHLLQLLSYYFTGDERFEMAGYTLDTDDNRTGYGLGIEGDANFESAGYVLTKGLLIAGSQPGQGKTTLMRLFAHNPRCSFAILNCHEIASSYKRQGEEVLDMYAGESGTLYNNPFRQAKGGFCFDDLGTESVAKHYGNECNVMEHILLTRYSNLSNDGAPLTWRTTHLTTNLTAEQIGAQYGARIRSRMREMFNLIDLPTDTPDRRR